MNISLQLLQRQQGRSDFSYYQAERWPLPRPRGTRGGSRGHSRCRSHKPQKKPGGVWQQESFYHQGPGITLFHAAAKGTTAHTSSFQTPASSSCRIWRGYSSSSRGGWAGAATARSSLPATSFPGRGTPARRRPSPPSPHGAPSMAPLPTIQGWPSPSWTHTFAPPRA